MKLIPRFGGGGKGDTAAQLYDHVTTIYQSFIDQGIDPQTALELTNQKVAEKGWTGYATGDNKKFSDVESFTRHVIDWHRRMYPDSLGVKNFDLFYQGVNGTQELWQKNKSSNGKLNGGRNYYNSVGEYNSYKNHLLKTRGGVRRRINLYRATKGEGPLAFVPIDNLYAALDESIV